MSRDSIRHRGRAAAAQKTPEEKGEAEGPAELRAARHTREPTAQEGTTSTHAQRSSGESPHIAKARAV